MDLDDEELKATRTLNGTDKKTADEMFEELGYKKWIDGRNIIHFIHKKKEKDFTFMKGNCYSIKRPTKEEQIAINKKCEELGWI